MSPGRTRRAKGAARPAAPAGRASAARRALPVLLALAAAALAALAYRGALGHAFLTWDDTAYVGENPLVLQHRWGALLRAIVRLNFHPLTLLTLAANAGSPLSPRPFLLTNIALHALDTALVFALAWGLSRRRAAVAFLAALLFGLHPLHVESVAWISERKDVLYAAFFLGAAIVYLRYLATRAAGWLALAFALFALSCLAKGMAASFPGVMLLLDAWHGRSLREARPWLEKLPFLALALLVGLVAIDVQAGGDFHGLLVRVDPHLRALSTDLPYTPLQRAGFAAYACAWYLLRFLVPAGLASFHPYPAAAQASEPQYLLAPLVVLALVALALRDLRRGRLFAFGFGWYLVCVVPVLQLVPVGAAIVAERYAYLALVGPGIALALGLARLAERRPAARALWAAAVLCCAGLFALTARQVRTWRDTDTLWSNVLARHPDLPLAYVARGTWRGQQGRVAEARADLESALALGYRGADAYFGLGIVYGSLGRPDSALAMFDRARTRDPGWGKLSYDRALTWLQLGRADSALADLDRAEPGLGAESTLVLGPRGYALLQLGEPARALAAFDRALAAAGGKDATSLYYRGACRLRLGDRAGAVSDFREALRLDPRRADARAQLQALGAAAP